MTSNRSTSPHRAPLRRAFQWIRDLVDGTRMTVTYPAKLHAYQHLAVAFTEAGVLPGGVAYCVEHKGQRAAIPTPDGGPRLVVNHEPGCPIAYDPATDRFTRWCDCAFGLHLPTRVLGAKAAA